MLGGLRTKAAPIAAAPRKQASSTFYNMMSAMMMTGGPPALSPASRNKSSALLQTAASCSPGLSPRPNPSRHHPLVFPTGRYNSGRRMLQGLPWCRSRPFSASPVCASAAPKKGEWGRMEKGDREYWEEVLTHINRATNKEIAKKLNMDYLYGVEPKVTLRSNPADFFLTVKKQHPRAIALVQIGKFYEAVGLDAILLMEYGGLNPMGGEAKAGTPPQNVQELVRRLIYNADMPLEVALCVELETDVGIEKSSKTKKDRAVRGVYNRANPNCDLNMLEQSSVNMMSDLFLESYPVVAVSGDVSGFTLYEVDVETRQIRVSDGLSREAVDTRIERGGICPPLFIHSPIYSTSSDRIADMQSEEQKHVHYQTERWKDMAGELKEFGGDDPLEQLKVEICKKQGWGADDVGLFTKTEINTTDGPKPLYLSTANQLGLERTRGVPSLLDHMLPKDHLMLKLWMKQLLMSPPAPHVAAAVCEATRQLVESQGGFPAFPITRPKQICKLIIDKEVSAPYFREIHNLCKSVQAAFENKSSNGFASEMLSPTSIIVGKQTNSKDLLGACSLAEEMIQGVVLMDGDSDTPEPVTNLSDYNDNVYKFLCDTEASFRGRVKVQHIQDEVNDVQEKAVIVKELVKDTIKELNALANMTGENKLACFSMDGMAFKVGNKKMKKIIDSDKKFINARSENGENKTVKTKWTTKELEQAIDDYKLSCARAAFKTNKKLKELAGDLQGETLQFLVAASWFAVGCQALISHVEEGLRRGWKLPDQDLNKETRVPLEIKGSWPYWMDRMGDKTVKNSLTINEMMILTGPNMAGKSTILRQVAACALLGTCGLMVPCESITVPYIDSFILRTFSQDNPLDGISSYGVECKEMASVQQDVTKHSLLLVDELGKGTEVNSGTAMAGALLEELDAVGCRSIFASHLHGLLTVDLNIPNTKFIKMETAIMDDQGALGWNNVPLETMRDCNVPLRKPTWRVVEGKCSESLALTVALEKGVKPETVKRASELLSIISAGGGGLNASTVASKAEDEKDEKQEEEGRLGIPSDHRVSNEQWQPGTDAAVPADDGRDIPGTAATATAFQPRGGEALKEWFDLSKIPSTAPACLERFFAGETIEQIASTGRAKPIKEATVVTYIVETAACGGAAPASRLDWDALFRQAGFSSRDVLSSVVGVLEDPGVGSVQDANGRLRGTAEGRTVTFAQIKAVAAWMSLGSPELLEGGSGRPSVTTQQEEPRPLAEPPVVHQAAEGITAAKDAAARGWHTSEVPAPRSSDDASVGAWLRAAASQEASPGTSAMSTAAAAAAATQGAAGPSRVAAAEVDQPPRSPGGGRSLDDANHLLTQVCERVKAQHGGGPYPSIKISPEILPPPSFAMKSCIYVCRWDNGWFYVGESDDIKGRVETHRRSNYQGLTGGRKMEVVFVPVAQGKSIARLIEKLLQDAMTANNFPLLSDSDSRHRNFGTR